MTVQAIRGIGYCARMTRCGDWAFDYSLDLAARFDVRLDIFFFPTPPSRSIEEFAESLPCPTVLVGPERPTQFFVNTPAGVWIERLGLDDADCHHVKDVMVQAPSPEH